jgi:predicted DCC family thiol-disulfide oxidoreductase YuxK
MDYAVIFFDGVCNFCNATVNFIIKQDKKDKFRFATLQSEYAKKFLLEMPEKYKHTDSIILFENGLFFIKSSAMLRIAKRMGGLWQLLFVLSVVPVFLRDFIYDRFARNRYRWFGIRNQCLIPDERLKRKFLN